MRLSRDPLADPEPLIRRVYAYVAYRIGDGPDAEDVTSETFERALRYRASYDPSRGTPLGWLIGIARRCIEDARDARSILVAEPPESPSPGDLEEDSLRRLTLSAAVASLGEHDRELLALRYGADLTARRIGEILDQPTNTIEVALVRARERLRRRLAGEADPESAGVQSTPRAGSRPV